MERFPEDFMFQLTELEIKEMVSQNVIPSKKVLGGAKPYAFTEQGVAMLSSVLRSPTAVNVNIAVMRAFVLMRRMIAGYGELHSPRGRGFWAKFSAAAENLIGILRL